MMLCHNDLDLYQIDPKIDREHLLSMTDVCNKFKKAGSNQTLVIDRTRLYMKEGRTDRKTGAEQYTPSSSKKKKKKGGGGKKERERERERERNNDHKINANLFQNC